MDTNLVALLWWVIGTILLCYLTAIVATHATNRSWAKAAEFGYYHAYNKRIYKVMIYLEDISLLRKDRQDETSIDSSRDTSRNGGDA